MAVLLVLMGTLATVTGLSTPALREARAAENLASSRQSFFLAESLTEDVVYRLKSGVPVSPTEELSVGSDTASATITDVFGGKEVRVIGDRRDLIRMVTAKLVQGSGVAFHYGMQADKGGIRLENSASVRGNAYANGTVSGSNLNMIYGDVVSAGSTGLINGVHATGTAYAHTIQDSTIDRDAHYQTISNTTVGGTSYPGSADLATTSLPISDSMIAEWEATAEAGGTITSPCPYQVTTSVSIGPKKIACDFEISGSPTVTLAGALWVTGNITIKNSAKVRVDASLTGRSVPLIADNPQNQLTSSKILLQNSSVFSGAGDGSYIAIISQNRSAEVGGSEIAIDTKNSATGAILLYAGHGEILLQNSAKVREMSAWRIYTKNSAEVVYETGLASILFSSGPEGGYSVDFWRETK